jgi:hypothetical protein
MESCKNVQILKNYLFAMFRTSAVHMYFSSTIWIQKCTGFRKSAFLLCLDDLQICNSNVFFINNPNLIPKLGLHLVPKKSFGSTTLIRVTIVKKVAKIF